MKSVLAWYEDPAHIDEMAGWDRGKLKIWERRACERFPAGGRVLDIGCGIGREAFALSALGFRVVGIDISAGAIGRARAAGGDVRFEVYDGEHIPFDDESFDVVVLWSQTFGLLYGDAYKRRLLRQCAGVLRPGGLLSFSGHSRAYLAAHHADCLKGRRFYPYRGADIYWESFNAAELERPAQETDFSVLETGEGQIYRPEDGVVLCCLCQKGDEECR